jgi:hypothetical protein
MITQTYDPAVYKLVPVDPTDEMTFIGQSLRYVPINSIGTIYRAMLAAVPSDLPGVVTHSGEPAAFSYERYGVPECGTSRKWIDEIDWGDPHRDGIVEGIRNVVPLYTHADPAGVAALRQRVAEANAVIEELLDAPTCCGTSYEPQDEDELKRIRDKAKAYLKGAEKTELAVESRIALSASAASERRTTFETWVVAEAQRYCTEPLPQSQKDSLIYRDAIGHQTYFDHITQIQWAAYQAGQAAVKSSPSIAEVRDAALEEAAKIAESPLDGLAYTRNPTPYECARAIRALKSAPAIEPVEGASKETEQPQGRIAFPMPYSKSEKKELARCHADRDGECVHKDCPQLRDGEPKKSGRHCPLDTDTGAEQ